MAILGGSPFRFLFLPAERERPPVGGGLSAQWTDCRCQLQAWADPPVSDSQNFGKALPPLAPVAGIAIICSDPVASAIPLGTTSEG
jgi:hypothetical protein